MDKAFSPAAVEARWRARWDELRVGSPSPSGGGRPSFVIALPPPNITGVLHLGHALQQSVQDILCRHRRMRGDDVEWCPGTDHAAIATQNVIERQLAEEGSSKEELGRERFAERVDAWYAEYGGRIFDQMRRLGFSCDWERARFTLDPEYVRAIRVAFKALFDEGLIYRGPRIVNWCPRCRSSISDEEVDWQEHHDVLYRIRYPVEGGGEVVIATVRPETMLGDTGLAVAPGDPRHAELVGRTAVLPLVGRRLPIFEDAAVEPEFGTGALKVTPGHDPTDYEIGQRHALPIVGVIGLDGRMTVPDLPRFDGLTVEEARPAVVAALREQDAVVGEEEYVHDVAHCDRCGSVIEPLVSEQWWVRMESLARPAIAAAEAGSVRLVPARHAEVLLQWLRGIRDWCISRQLWLGHAIPASLCVNGHRFAWIDPPQRCPECGSAELSADPDVLDTWFSSALWPFAIFGWPDDTADLRRFYPTDVLVTAREIIFLWVARMIMTGAHLTGRLPFHEVIINATILAPDGTRMSKSRGNAVDPLDMVDRYGADAVRAWAAAVGTSGQDMRFDEDRVAAYRLFANKLWNVTRLLAGRLGDGDRIGSVGAAEPGELLVEDRWILDRVAACAATCDAALGQRRFHEALDALYDTLWHSFCDWYVEMIKSRLQEGAEPAGRRAAAWTATTALDVLLRLLHPFMPFVTEECAQRLPAAAATLQHREWPSPPRWWRDPQARRVDRLLELVQQVRIARQDAVGTSRERLPLVIRGDDGTTVGRADLVRLLGTVAAVEVVEDPPAGATAAVVAGGVEASLHAAGGDARARLERQLADAEAQAERDAARLATAGFVERAPAEVVEQARRRLAEARARAEALRRALDPQRGAA